LNTVLQTTSPIPWGDIVGGVFIGAVGVYNFIESPSSFYGILVLIILYFLFVRLFKRDEIRFDTSGKGMVESKVWTFAGRKTYKHEDLSQANEIALVYIGGESGKRTKSYLLFNDGCMCPIPDNDVFIEKVVSFFQSNYEINLSIKKEDRKTLQIKGIKKI